MMAYQYANIKNYLHGIAFNGSSDMPWGFAIWPPFFKQTGGRSEPHIEQFVDAMFLEDVRGDARQLLNGLETIEELFEHFCVGPAAAVRMVRIQRRYR
jgi:hypothetical protein